jgi:hypothetical protein
MASPQPPKTIFVPHDVLESAEVVVTKTPATLLPGHRVLTAGANVTLDATTPDQLIVSSTGGGGGGVAAHAPTHEPGGTDPLTVDAVPATGSLRTLGPGANQAAPGDDARFTNARPPTAHHTTHEPGGTDPLAVDAVPATGSLRTLGTGPNQATAGNDARLTNARTPTAHKTTHEPGGSDALTVDAVPATGSLRTLGTGANQAAPGNDARFTDARTPTAHKLTHQTGGSDIVDVKLLGGYPGGTVNFLRADGTFAAPSATVDLSGYVPYTGATTNVNLNTKSLVAGIGTFSGYLSSAGTLVVANNPAASANEQHYAGIRFVDNLMAAGSKEWRIVTSGGNLYFQTAADGGAYGNLTALTFTRAGAATFAAAVAVGTDLTTGAAVISKTYVYPGRVDVGGGATQTSWFLASHGSYGLYTNTGFYCANHIWAAGQIYPAGGMPSAYLVGEVAPTDFTPNLNGSMTIDAQYSAYYWKHNGWLTVCWMWGVNFHLGNSYGYFQVPGGFTNQRYAEASPVIYVGGQDQPARIECAPGDIWIYVYSNDGRPFGGPGFRYGGQIMLWVG